VCRSALAAGLLCLGLAGCSLAAGGKSAPTTYDLIAARSFAAVPKAKSWQLVVVEPTAVQALDTNRILVRPGADQISYFKGAAWSDRLPRLVQTRTVETLQNAGVAKAVLSSSERAGSEYLLAMEIRAFEIDVSGRPASADVDIFAKLISAGSFKVIASKGFSAQVAAANDTPPAGVAALNQALTEVLQDASGWVATARR
jgi:cholesterol transport system auxiliary component